MEKILFLKPVFVKKIWGGRKLADNYGYKIPDGKVGECWAISAHPDGDCMIDGGRFAGLHLSKVYAENKELFDNPKEEVFPLLTKIIDASDILSVQVHPDDEYGFKNEGEQGKTECWYILDAEEGAEIVYGHKAQTKKEFENLIKTGEWDKLLRYVKVKAGDFFFVPSGTIHAIGKGITILETQQSSNTTYRVFDFDRTDDRGNKRDLHIDRSIDVSSIPHKDPQYEGRIEKIDKSIISDLIDCQYFSVYKWDIDGRVKFNKKGAYTLVSVLEGEGSISINGDQYKIKKGMHFIILASARDWEIEGKLMIIASNPKS